MPHNKKTDETKTSDTELSENISEGLAEVLVTADIIVASEERLVLVEEVLEKFVSPLMIQRAAGATSQVTVTTNPSGGVSSAQSVKARNALVNLKYAVVAVPASLPALASFYEKHGISGELGGTALAVLYLFAVLKPLAQVLKVTLTQQAAAVLKVMWENKKESEDTVPLEGLLTKVNATFQEYGWKTVEEEDLTAYLLSLEKIKAIERAGEFESIGIGRIRWRLKEAVKIAR